ncbi:uncharacterized protein LOC123988243 [Osmia bicornis bicornis]|uniref:uncharacterized protein LOC123988243 n=1 Tax=Osmia bicornis bicornis TaxID=1437191 RepID=UPI001EAE9CFE|nr:uncharacterized protein LOC123988243 [Osmia bicornis bicornis]
MDRERNGWRCVQGCTGHAIQRTEFCMRAIWLFFVVYLLSKGKLKDVASAIKCMLLDMYGSSINYQTEDRRLNNCYNKEWSEFVWRRNERRDNGSDCFRVNVMSILIN